MHVCVAFASNTVLSMGRLQNAKRVYFFKYSFVFIQQRYCTSIMELMVAQKGTSAQSIFAHWLPRYFALSPMILRRLAIHMTWA